MQRFRLTVPMVTVRAAHLYIKQALIQQQQLPLQLLVTDEYYASSV